MNSHSVSMGNLFRLLKYMNVRIRQPTMGECMNLNLIPHQPTLGENMNLRLMPQCLPAEIVVTGCFQSVLDMLLAEQLLRINLECVLPDHVSAVAFCDLFLLPLPCRPFRTLSA